MKTWKIGQAHRFAVNWQILKYRNIARLQNFSQIDQFLKFLKIIGSGAKKIQLNWKIILWRYNFENRPVRIETLNPLLSQTFLHFSPATL